MARTSATRKSKQLRTSPAAASKPARAEEHRSGSPKLKSRSDKSPRLDDTALVILSAAAERSDGLALPYPSSLKSPKATIQKKLSELISRGLLKEATAKLEDPIWRTDEQQRHLTLKITETGIAAIDGGVASVSEDRRDHAALKAKPAEHTPKSQSKSDLILGLLRRPDGASLEDLCSSTGWQPHSVRGFLSGTVRKKLRLNVESIKSEAGERRYRLPAESN